MYRGFYDTEGKDSRATGHRVNNWATKNKTTTRYRTYCSTTCAVIVARIVVVSLLLSTYVTYDVVVCSAQYMIPVNLFTDLRMRVLIDAAVTLLSVVVFFATLRSLLSFL